jgi:hypothetical protein
MRTSTQNVEKSAGPMKQAQVRGFQQCGSSVVSSNNIFFFFYWIDQRVFFFFFRRRRRTTDCRSLCFISYTESFQCHVKMFFKFTWVWLCACSADREGRKAEEGSEEIQKLVEVSEDEGVTEVR